MPADVVAACAIAASNAVSSKVPSCLKTSRKRSNVTAVPLRGVSRLAAAGPANTDARALSAEVEVVEEEEVGVAFLVDEEEE